MKNILLALLVGILIPSIALATGSVNLGTASISGSVPPANLGTAAQTLFTLTTPATIVSSTVKTDMISGPTITPVAGQNYKIEAYGIYSATSSTGGFTLAVAKGSATLFTEASTASFISTSGQVVFTFFMTIPSTTTAQTYFTGVSNTTFPQSGRITTPTTILATAEALHLYITESVNSSSDSFTLQNCVITQY